MTEIQGHALLFSIWESDLGLHETLSPKVKIRAGVTAPAFIPRSGETKSDRSL